MLLHGEGHIVSVATIEKVVALCAEDAADDSRRVGRVRAHIDHLRRCADEIPSSTPTHFYKTARVNHATIQLRRQAQDIEDLLEGRVDAAGNPVAG